VKPSASFGAAGAERKKQLGRDCQQRRRRGRPFQECAAADPPADDILEPFTGLETGRPKAHRIFRMREAV
jgi:hypothetical protein